MATETPTMDFVAALDRWLTVRAGRDECRRVLPGANFTADAEENYERASASLAFAIGELLLSIR